MNRKLQNNAQGFSIVEGLLILAVIALIGGVGWYAYGHRSKSTKTSNQSNVKTQTVAGKDTTVTGNKLTTRCFETTFPDKISFTSADQVTGASSQQEMAVKMTSIVNDCNSNSAWEGVKDFPIFKVAAVKHIESSIDEDEQLIIKSLPQGSVQEKDRIKVDGHDAVKVIFKDSDQLTHILIAVRGPKGKNESGNFEGFVIRGYYYNDAYRNTFDPALATLKWKI